MMQMPPAATKPPAAAGGSNAANGKNEPMTTTTLTTNYKDSSEVAAAAASGGFQFLPTTTNTTTTTTTSTAAADAAATSLLPMGVFPRIAPPSADSYSSFPASPSAAGATSAMTARMGGATTVPSSSTPTADPLLGGCSAALFESPMDISSAIFSRFRQLPPLEEAMRALSFPEAENSTDLLSPLAPACFDGSSGARTTTTSATTMPAAADATCPASFHPVSREVMFRVAQQQQQQQQKQDLFAQQQQQQQSDWQLAALSHQLQRSLDWGTGCFGGAAQDDEALLWGNPFEAAVAPRPTVHMMPPHSGDREDSSAAGAASEQQQQQCTNTLVDAPTLAQQLLLLSSQAADLLEPESAASATFAGTPMSLFLQRLETEGDYETQNLVASLLNQSAPGRLAAAAAAAAVAGGSTLSPQQSSLPNLSAEQPPLPTEGLTAAEAEAGGLDASRLDASRLDASRLDGRRSGGGSPVGSAFDEEVGDEDINGILLAGGGVRDYNASELTGRVVSLAKVQYGSRLLQRLLARGAQEHIELILQETAGQFPQLMTDPYGNYLCQQLFEVCSKTQRRQILMRLAPHTVSIAEDRRGTHSLQSLISLVQDEKEELLLLRPMLKSDLLSLSTHPHATHVIQRALMACGPRVKAMIFDPIILRLSDVARTPHGICVVKRCISAAATEPACESFKHPLLRKLSASAISLIQSPYGNYAIQHALDAFGPELCRPILRQVIDNFVLLSTQKFSSNVVEKSISVGSAADITKIVQIAFQPTVVRALLSSSYGSFVIQKLISRMDDNEASTLLSLLLQSHSDLSNKRLRLKWERLVSSLCERLGFDVADGPWRPDAAALSTAPSTPPPECGNGPPAPSEPSEWLAKALQLQSRPPAAALQTTTTTAAPKRKWKGGPSRTAGANVAARSGKSQS